MAEYVWPLKNKLPIPHFPFTKEDLLDALEEFPDDTPLWIDNYRQIRHNIAQRPVDVMYIGDDGFHLG
jgi:hypothetical protein